MPVTALHLQETLMAKARHSTPFLGLLLCLVLVSCGEEPPKPSCVDPLGCVVIGPGEPIKIGVLQALSGKVAPLGQEQLRGLELAVRERDGQVAGHPLSMQTEDTGCTGEGGANAALKIVADPKMVAIFGTTCSGDAATAAKVMSTAGLTMISGNNSAPFLTAIGGLRAPNWQAGYFRTAPNEEHAGSAAATYAYTTLGKRKAATVNDGDIYTRGLTDGFARTFTQLGGTVVLDASVAKGDSEMGPLLAAVATVQADLLFFPLFQPEANHLLAQARKNKNLHQLTLMSDGALVESSFLAAVGELARGMYFVGPSPAVTPRSAQLAKVYLDTFKVAPATSYYQSGYDAVDLLFTAIEHTVIRRADGSLLVGREALRRFLYASTNFAGVTGSLTCDRFGDCAEPRFDVLRLDDPGAGVAGLQQNVLFTHAPTRQEAPIPPQTEPGRP